MTDLIKAYFERDLTEAENDSLDSILSSSSDEALRYSRLAEKFYCGLGLPMPQGSGIAGTGWKIVKTFLSNNIIPLAVIGVLGTWITTVKIGDRLSVIPPSTPMPIIRQQEKPVMPVVPAKPPQSAGGAVQASAALATASGAVYPIQYDPRVKYGELSVIVNQARGGILTVRVTDEDGVEVRVLYAGYLEKGMWVMEWDGKKAKSGFTNPGDYIIEVQSEDHVLKKPIRILTE